MGRSAGRPRSSFPAVPGHTRVPSASLHGPRPAPAPRRRAHWFTRRPRAPDALHPSAPPTAAPSAPPPTGRTRPPAPLPLYALFSSAGPPSARPALSELLGLGKPSLGATLEGGFPSPRGPQ